MRVATALFALLLVGCAQTDKTFLPVQLAPVYMRMPSQQKAAAEAVKKATSTLDFKEFSGRSAFVEVNGVFPHTYKDLLDYISSLVEGKMATGGMLVFPTDYDAKVGGGSGAAPPEAEDEDEVSTLSAVESVEFRQYKRTREADYRVIISVGAGGADLRVVDYPWYKNLFGVDDERYYNGIVDVVVTLIPLKTDLKAASFECQAQVEHRVQGDEDETPYTDDVFGMF